MLTADCQKVVYMIQYKVLAKHCYGESKAFFLEMVGDSYRYIAENTKDSQLEAVNFALKAGVNE